MKDYYETLGVSQNASKDEIRKAYKKLAHKHHPDKGGDEQKFKEISEAYKVLSDDNKRAQYDKFGQTTNGAGAGGEGAGGFGGFGQEGFGQGFDSINIEDLFNDMFGMGMGGGARQGSRRKDMNRGGDIGIALQLNLEDTLENLKKNISVKKQGTCDKCGGRGAQPGTKMKQCPTCKGTGEIRKMRRTFLGTLTERVVCPDCGGKGEIPEKLCDKCGGSGRVEKTENIELQIPAGVESGQTLKVPGQGHAGKRGGESGDLFVEIQVKSHPKFERKGDDLHTSLSVPFTTLILGGKVDVPTLEGKSVTLKIPAGTQAGKVFRISNKGIPHFSSWGRGNLYVKVELDIPEKLNKKQKQLLNQLKENKL